MHMADALLSPAVGGAFWAAGAAILAGCSRKLRNEFDDGKIPLMGVLAAFIFAAQMINFTIPGTGSSGHLGGGMILAILLGPCAGFLAMASVLTVQALFFADGGLLALGCNIFNLGFFPCFIACPLIFRPLLGRAPTRGRLLAASLVAAVAALQLGAFFVVLQTLLSGISELPFAPFLMLMLPIHLAIGVVEGLVTAAVVGYVWKARPEILTTPGGKISAPGWQPVLLGLTAATLLVGGILSWFASSHPDGLEWAMFHASGREELAAPEAGAHQALAEVQEKTALLPDYGFKASADGGGEVDEAWPAVDTGTSLSGLVGGLLTLMVAGLAAWLLRGRSRA
ncbi:MAG: energy-coupling factor ABC transporter permease [Trichloromonas sp.]|jgi:cobalt/nickel transport system permease protein|nr:energy-coupling factor ABC transporter permease [Trichloromonas sp.]